MSHEPLITIGMPVYNGARFLKEALDSAFGQTHKNLEVLLFNDGSSDATLEIARNYNDPRLVIIDASRNSGAACGRQIIKTLARGDYLTWLDVDDRFLPQRLSRLLQHAEHTGADLVCETYRCIEEAGRPTETLIRMPEYITTEKHFTRLFERNRMMPHPLIRRRCYQAVDFDLTLRTAQDYDYWLKCSWNGFTFSRLDEVLLEYRITGGSLSSNHARNMVVARKILEKYPVEEVAKLYRDRGFDEAIINCMACLQYIFRQQYDMALDYARQPWADEAGIDRAFYLGTLSLQSEDIPTAVEYLRNHLERQPDSPAGLNNMGIAIRRQGQDASTWFSQALAMFPNYRDALDNQASPDSQHITLTQLSTGRLR